MYLSRFIDREVLEAFFTTALRFTQRETNPIFKRGENHRGRLRGFLSSALYQLSSARSHFSILVTQFRNLAAALKNLLEAG